MRLLLAIVLSVPLAVYAQRPAEMLAAKAGAAPRSNLPAGFKDYQAVGFAIAYPAAWRLEQPADDAIFLAPQSGVKGGHELLLGGMVGYYVPESGAAAVSLDTTKELLDNLQESDSTIRAGKSERVEVGGKPGLLTRLNSKTSLQQEPDQVTYMYTVAREAGLWYVMLAAQPSRLKEFDPIFKQMISTVQFPD